jgi:5-methyltetrahydrofolate--homocysteine methyltransferase
MPELSKLYDAILSGDHKAAIGITREAIDAGTDAMQLVSGYMVPAMDEVGRRFECEEYFVPELLLSGRAMKSALELLRPLLAAAGAEPAGRAVIGTVKGDLHDIGKNLVGAMLEGAGLEVIDLGADVEPSVFVQTVKDRKPHLVCLSALLTVTMPAMKTTIAALENAGVRNSVKVLVGGAPITREFAETIGADAYGESATAAVTLARRFVRPA